MTGSSVCPTRRARPARWRLLVVSPGLLASACAVGPDYVRPAVETPPAFKEAAGWKAAQPRDDGPRDRWWEVYGDQELDQLIEQVDVSNQNIKQAEAQYRAARAAAASARAAYFPALAAEFTATRATGGTNVLTATAPGAGGASSGGTSTSASSSSAGVSNVFSPSLDASWEIDIWGKLRRMSENATANMNASAADLGAALLSARSALAQDYFALRITDEMQRLYAANVEGLQRSLNIAGFQYSVGVASQADIAQAQTLLKSTQAAEIELEIQRAQLEHAIALLIGKPPSEFSLPPAALSIQVPEVPLAQPSVLLERRPDVAASERAVAAANANIGVAMAAYYPTLTLSGQIGFENGSLTRLFSFANRFWSVGPALAETLFDGGARRGATRQAIANYDASVAAYRQTVLAAFQDTEDNLVALRVLAEEISVQSEAAKAADKSEDIALFQYKSGIASYLNVVVAQSTALANERALLSLRGRQLASSVALVKSLGGGWNASMLANREP